MKITPNILLGTHRKIAYANKKYHSGTIWIGLTKKLDSKNISGSPNKKGNNIDRLKNKKKINKFNKSLTKK